MVPEKYSELCLAHCKCWENATCCISQHLIGYALVTNIPTSPESQCFTKTNIFLMLQGSCVVLGSRLQKQVLFETWNSRSRGKGAMANTQRLLKLPLGPALLPVLTFLWPQPVT